MHIPNIKTIEVLANENETVTKKHMLPLPYQGDRHWFNKIVRNLSKHLPNNVKMQVTFTGQKLSTQFNVKDRTKFEHKHDVIYFGKCPIILVNLLGESEAIVDHGG